MSAPPRRWRIRAPAKINLDLRVLGRRPDGFHDVRTILQSVALHDTLSLTARAGPFTVRSRAAGVPRDRDNLVWAAAAALWRALGRAGDPDGVAVTIRKRVPAQAGLGGASSDAAAALRVLRQLWAPAAGDRRLQAAAAAIGADVPFCLRGGTALGTGRGDRLRPLAPLDRQWVVLAVPPDGVSTAAAYDWWDRWPLRAPDGAAGARAPAGWRRAPGGLRNDLEAPVAARHPAIRALASALRRAGASHAAMTGSGSAVFGLFPSRAQAARARAALAGGAARTLLTRTLDLAAYRRLAAIARIL